METELPPKRGTAPQFSAHVCCGQTAGTEVGLDPGDIALDGDQLPSQKGGAQPPMLIGPWEVCVE